LVDAKGSIAGVQVQGPDGEMTINCKSIVLATGGFGANSDMIVQYNPALAGFSTTNQSGATGDGIAMATAIGAGLTDIEQIQTHPTVNPDTSDMYTEGVRGNGAILVNAEGKRFVSEMETRDVVSNAILAQTDGICWLLFDEAVRQSLKAIESYIALGIIYESDTIEGLAEQIGVNPATLKETMTTYAGYAADKVDAEFGRIDTSMGFPLTMPKFYAGKCAPAVHHTMGGVKINPETQVLTALGAPIAGLYAAGEVTGGVHGANRLGGNAVADIVVFGRIAGSGAHAYVLANGGTTTPTIVIQPEDEVKPEVQGSFTNGTYTGTGQGNMGSLTVEVVVESNNIVSITLKEHTETPGVFEAAEKDVIAAIIRTQQLDVDTVSGATNTSNGIMQAVQDALK
jgi:fumarate reductase flavoprotein subunit